MTSGFGWWWWVAAHTAGCGDGGAGRGRAGRGVRGKCAAARSARCGARGSARASTARRLLRHSCREPLRERSRALFAPLRLVTMIESVRVKKIDACLRCCPPPRYDRHGYIDMGTDSSRAPPTLPPHTDRCFLMPPPPPRLYQRSLDPAGPCSQCCVALSVSSAHHHRLHR